MVDGGLVVEIQGSRNAILFEQFSELFCGGAESEALAGPVVEFGGDGAELGGGPGRRSVPLGRYSRSRPLMFSLLPRCQGV